MTSENNNLFGYSKKTLITNLIPELYCTSIKKSILFYTEMLAFNIQYQREDEGFVMLERQGSQIMLEEIRETNRTWISAPLEIPFGRGINLQIKTNKIDELYLRIQKAKGNTFLPIEEKWYQANHIELGHRQFIVLDPDGYMLRFVQTLGEKHNEKAQITSSLPEKESCIIALGITLHAPAPKP